MKNGHLDLFMRIKELQEKDVPLTVPELGVTIAGKHLELTALFLYELIEDFQTDTTNTEREYLDPIRVQKGMDIIESFVEHAMKRVFLMGANAHAMFETFKTKFSKDIVEDELNRTIKIDQGVYFTIGERHDWYKIFPLLSEKQVLIVVLSPLDYVMYKDGMYLDRYMMTGYVPMYLSTISSFDISVKEFAAASLLCHLKKINETHFKNLFRHLNTVFGYSLVYKHPIIWQERVGRNDMQLKIKDAFLDDLAKVLDRIEIETIQSHTIAFVKTFLI